jgi:hypothetical protein
MVSVVIRAFYRLQMALLQAGFRPHRARHARLVLVGAQTHEEKLFRQRRQGVFQRLEFRVIGLALELDGHDEPPAAPLSRPVQHQPDAPLRRGDDIAQQPVHRTLRHELERVALLEVHQRVRHQILAQLRAVHGGDTRAPVHGHVCPAPRAGAEVHARLVCGDALPEPLLRFDQFGEGAAGRGFVAGDGQLTLLKRPHTATQLPRQRGGSNREKTRVRRGQQQLHERGGFAETNLAGLQGPQQLASLLAEQFPKRLADEAHAVRPRAASPIVRREVQPPRLAFRQA